MAFGEAEARRRCVQMYMQIGGQFCTSRGQLPKRQEDERAEGWEKAPKWCLCCTLGWKALCLPPPRSSMASPTGVWCREPNLLGNTYLFFFFPPRIFSCSCAKAIFLLKIPLAWRGRRQFHTTVAQDLSHMPPPWCFLCFSLPFLQVPLSSQFPLGTCSSSR